MRTKHSILNLQDTTWSTYLTDYEGRLVGLDDLGRVWFITMVNVSRETFTALDIFPPSIQQKNVPTT